MGRVKVGVNGGVADVDVFPESRVGVILYDHDNAAVEEDYQPERYGADAGALAVIEVSGGRAEPTWIDAGLEVVIHDFDDEGEIGEEGYEALVYEGPIQYQASVVHRLEEGI